MTRIFHNPVEVEDGIVNFPVILLPDTTTVSEATISVLPVFCRRTTAPEVNPDPERLAMVTVVPLFAVLGVMLVILSLGGGVVTVNPPGRIADCPSGFVTTISQDPAFFPFRLNVQVIFVEDTIVTPVPLISTWPDFPE